MTGTLCFLSFVQGKVCAFLSLADKHSSPDTRRRNAKCSSQGKLHKASQYLDETVLRVTGFPSS